MAAPAVAAPAVVVLPLLGRLSLLRRMPLLESLAGRGRLTWRGWLRGRGGLGRLARRLAEAGLGLPAVTPLVSPAAASAPPAFAPSGLPGLSGLRRWARPALRGHSCAHRAGFLFALIGGHAYGRRKRGARLACAGRRTRACARRNAWFGDV